MDARTRQQLLDIPDDPHYTRITLSNELAWHHNLLAAQTPVNLTLTPKTQPHNVTLNTPALRAVSRASTRRSPSVSV